MKPIQPVLAYCGASVQTVWSSHVIIVQVLYSLKARNETFHGVKVETLNYESGHPLYYDGLLWVVEDGGNLRIWQECRQSPWITDGEVEGEIEEIIGHYESDTGSVYYAIKWMDYECPTWELEEDVLTCQLIDHYWLHCSGAGLDCISGLAGHTASPKDGIRI
ncbi:hypothetical protein BX600DRAFT_385289 [Xylariales sp. PMI_506]|nr:hypothetical protein BX600DRAFT_385289 [Xylariales sp. PMI_506]